MKKIFINLKDYVEITSDNALDPVLLEAVQACLNIFNTIKQNPNTEIIVYNSDEYRVPILMNENVWKNNSYTNVNLLNELDSLLTEYNVKMEFWIGNEDKNYIRQFDSLLNCDVVNWHLYCIFIVFRIFENFIIPKIPLDKLYTSLNNHAHNHRCYMIDKLSEYNLLKNGHVSWSATQYNKSYSRKFTNHQFKFFNNKTLVLDDWQGKFDRLPNQYFQSLFILVNETTPDILDISEKTWTAIYMERPFIVCGAKNVHRVLKDYGIQMYDELFDYSFDSLDNVNDRIDHIVNQIKNIKIDNYNEYYNTLLPKIKHNKKQMLKLIKECELPKNFFEYYNQAFKNFNDRDLDFIYQLRK
jgi:hypothetical protein